MATYSHPRTTFPKRAIADRWVSTAPIASWHSRGSGAALKLDGALDAISNLLRNVEKEQSTMDEYRFSNLVNYTHTQLSDMNNTSFYGYFSPWTMTSEESAEYWRVNQADANASVSMHDQNGAFVGFSRLDTRRLRGRCGSFSIVPEFRGTGASVLLAEQMVRLAGKQGLKTLQVEVLAQNTPALKLYEKVGFRITRELLTLEITTPSLSEAIPLQVQAVPTERVLPELHNRDRPY